MGVLGLGRGFVRGGWVLGVGRRRRPSGEERVGKLKSVPRRSWTAGASRAGGGTGKGGHEGNAKGVHKRAGEEGG